MVSPNEPPVTSSDREGLKPAGARLNAQHKSPSPAAALPVASGSDPGRVNRKSGARKPQASIRTLQAHDREHHHHRSSAR